MTENAVATVDKRMPSPGKRARKSHAIRFSDAEWETIQEQAEVNDMAPGEFVRHAALNLRAGEPRPVLAELPAGLVRLIETTYRAAYFASTVMRDEMIRDGRREEVDEIVKCAKEAQAAIMSGE